MDFHKFKIWDDFHTVDGRFRTVHLIWVGEFQEILRRFSQKIARDLLKFLCCM